MKRQIITTFLFLAFLLAARGNEITFGKVKIILIDSGSAAMALNQSDKYTASLNPFELKVRLKKNEKLSEKDYLNFASTQTQNWEPEEKQLLSKIFDSISRFCIANRIELPLPKQIELIKTHAGEEFEAEGYTRENRIMLNPGATTIDLHLVAHELFHVFSRYNEKQRDEIYRIFSFRRCNRIDYAAVFGGLVFTNPDCPVVEHYTDLSTDKARKKAALILYSRTNYQEGAILSDYFDVQLMELEGDRTLKPHTLNSNPVLYNLDASESMKHILKNTAYTLHPEEIAAEHFAMMIQGKVVKEKSYIDFLKEALRD